MYLIRPVETKDFTTLFSFAKSAAHGILSLPKQPELMEKKIAWSIESFGKEVEEVKKEFYFFVIEDLERGEVIGCSGIKASSGLDEPLCFFRQTLEKKTSSHISLVAEHTLLVPVNIKGGPSELCALYLTKNMRKSGIGSFLSLSRLLFVGAEKQRFQKKLMARIRGFITSDKSNPFWQHLGRHFLDIPFFDLLKLLEENPSCIPDIAPSYPVYVSLLAKAAQNVIGKPHPNSRPALQMLKHEGFCMTDDIDLFDAGPTVAANVDEIGIIKRIVHRRVQKIETIQGGRNQFMVAKGSGKDFRASIGQIKRFREQKEDVIVDCELAKALGLEVGDMILTTPGHKRRLS